MAKIRRCCVAGCSIKQGDTVLYSFPNPVTDSCRFLKWVTATGNPELLKQKPEQVRKSRKICQLHFSSEYIHVRNLNQLAYPSLHMPETLNLPANWFDISTDLKENAENVNIEPTAEYWPLTFSTVFEEVTSLPENPAIPRDVPDFAGTSIPLMSAQENVISIENSAITSSSTTATMFGIDGRPSLTPSTSTTESAENKIKNSNTRKKGVYWVSRNDQTVIKKLKQRVSYYQRQNMTLKKKLALVVKGSRNIYKRQLKSCRIRSQPRRFAESNEILPSTSLKQNRCYRLLSSLCALPSVTTSRKFLSKIPIYPGIIHQVFTSLRDVVKNLNMQERFCSLIFDEMFIQPHLQYRSSKGIACDPSDEEHTRKLEIANQVQVFMLHGIFSSWKQPVAYICGTTNSVTEIVHNYKLIIKEAHSAGFTVIASICGQRSANVRAIRMLLEETRKNALQKNMTIEDDVISIDGNIIVPIFDPSHLLKCMRNNLLSRDLTFHQDGISKTAKWT